MPIIGNGMHAMTPPIEYRAVCGMCSSSAYPPNTLPATSRIAPVTPVRRVVMLSRLDMLHRSFPLLIGCPPEAVASACGALIE